VNFSALDHGGQSVEDNSPNLDKLDQDTEGKDLLEDIEENTIGNMLPDDDELLAGIMEDFDLSDLPNQLEDLEDDLFGSGGGMELDYESSESLGIGLSKVSISDGVTSNGIAHYALPNGVGTVAGEHPYGEHPSRTLFVRNINSNVEDSELRSLFEVLFTSFIKILTAYVCFVLLMKVEILAYIMLSLDKFKSCNYHLLGNLEKCTDKSYQINFVRKLPIPY